MTEPRTEIIHQLALPLSEADVRANQQLIFNGQVQAAGQALIASLLDMAATLECALDLDH